MPFFQKKKENETEPEAYLLTADNEMELGLIEGILAYEKIPFIKKYNDLGGVGLAMGSMFNQEIEIYVGLNDLQRAKDALQKQNEQAFKNPGEE